MLSPDIGSVVCGFLDHKHIHTTTPEDLREMIDIFRVRLDGDDNYLIRWASINGHLGVVHLLLNDNMVDPTVQNNQPIRCASLFGHLEIVRLLLNDKRVDPEAMVNLAIHWASKYGHHEVVCLLLSDDRVRSSLFDFQLAIYERSIPIAGTVAR